MKRPIIRFRVLVLVILPLVLLIVVVAVIPGARTRLARWIMSDGLIWFTEAERLTQYGAVVDARWRPAFAAAGVVYPPERVVLVAFKEAKRMEIYAAGAGQKPRFIRADPIHAASGGPGPKLQEGDGQVPEGAYPIESLNPNSMFHLSLRIGYPNADDRAQAKIDGRNKLGGDIMIHGGAASIGCLAMGDEVAEDYFVLASRVGVAQVTVLIVPYDLRKDHEVAAGTPAWVVALYQRLAIKLTTLTR